MLELEYQKQLSTQQTKVQEDERRKIAQRVHDDIGSRLNILAVWLNNPSSWQNPEAKKIILDQLPQINLACKEVSHSLYPFTIEHFGLISSIEEIVFNIPKNIKAQFSAPDSFVSRSIATDVQIYRLVQEFVNNTIKHANATQLSILMKPYKQNIFLVLYDNGKGLNFEKIERGIGLTSIQTRLKSMDAAFKWKTQENKGLRLIIAIPYEN